MIQTIILVLVELGLLREDLKHHRKISNKEKENGIKRPFYKYFLQPSSIVLIFVFVIAILSSFLFFNYQSKFIFPKKTKKEIEEMSDRMENWNENLGRYPIDLNELIGDNPTRQGWRKDAWNRVYKFTIT